MKSVNINEWVVLPVPTDSAAEFPCCGCKGSSRWMVNEAACCSSCFLFRLLKNQAEQVGDLLKEVGRNLGRELEFGQLSPEDADRVVGGVVMAQRFELARTRNERR